MIFLRSRRFLLVSSVFLSAAAPVAPVHRVLVPTHAPLEFVDIRLSDLPASEVVSVLMRDVVRGEYVAAPDVQSDRRLVSVDIRGPLPVAQRQAREFLQGLGVVSSGGPVFKLSLESSHPAKEAKPVPVLDVYKPRWRDAGYLASLASSAFPDARVSAGGAASVSLSRSMSSQSLGGSSRNSIGSSSVGFGMSSGYSGSSMSGGVSTQPADLVVFRGERKDIGQFRQLMARADVAQGEVLVRAVLFEVSTKKDTGSALNLAVALLKSKITGELSQPSLGASSLSSPSSAASAGALTVHVAGVDAVVQALSSDQRFRVVTAPTARVRSGASTQFTVGDKVPVLGSVSYAGNGSSSTPVQSVEYMDSGVIFSVAPSVREDVIDVNLNQVISSFHQTNTGVNTTPSLTQRQLNTSLSVHDGDVICMGGLSESDDTKSRQGFGFLPAFLQSRQKTNTGTEILLVLSVQRLDDGEGRASAPDLLLRGSLPAVPALPLLTGGK